MRDELDKDNLFFKFLVGKFNGNSQQALQFLEIAEHVLPDIINSNFIDRPIQSIYEISDIYEIEDYGKRITKHPLLNSLNMSSEPRYTEVLQWYGLYIKQSAAGGTYVMEEGKQAELGKTTNVKVSDRKQVTISTIFSEGEYGETDGQDKEFRRRNMELRKACIEYFKQLHNGHIVCECCGFDYTKAYKIDDEYIEIHHRFPFAHTEGEHLVNAATDLVPLCANCHRMIHHGQGGKGNCMSVEELKQIYIGKVYR